MTEHFAHLVRGAGPGLLLAHGAGGSVEGNFGALLERLAATRTVVGADYPGAGRTPRSAVALDLDRVADELVRTAVAAGTGTFDVLGYSLGALVAVRIATRHPERVTGLVLTAGFARLDNRLRLTLDLWRALHESGDRVRQARFLTLLATGPSTLESMSPRHLEVAVQLLAAFIPDGTPEHIALAEDADVRAELAAIAVPTLVVATTADQLVPLGLQRELAAAVPGAELVEVAAGHLIGTEAPDDWFAAVEAFLAR